MDKLWGGRFKKKMDQQVLRFSSSIDVDQRLAEYDIQGSIAHVKMLARISFLGRKESTRIVKALNEILSSVKSGRFRPDFKYEDIHSNIQALLEKKVGHLAEKLHTARSRNDQVVLDVRMYARDSAGEIVNKINEFQKAVLHLAESNIDVIVPGYTHLQRAQPILWSHQLLAYLEMLERDRQRLEQAAYRANEMPLGSCALAGTQLPVDRDYLARLLGFRKASANSIDSVSDRDFIVEMLAALAILAMHLSRICEDLIIWSSSEFAFITIDEAFCTGSSIMPHKKNPDVLELIRGKTGRVYGGLIAVLVMMKGLPLSYNRDMQEDKRPLFKSSEIMEESLSILKRLLLKVKINKRRVREAVSDGLLLTTDVAEYLVKKGVSLTAAHNIVGRMVMFCLDNNRDFSKLSLAEMRHYSDKFKQDVFEILTPVKSVRAKKSPGSTNPGQVKRSLTKWQRKLNARI